MQVLVIMAEKYLPCLWAQRKDKVCVSPALLLTQCSRLNFTCSYVTVDANVDAKVASDFHH